VVETNNTKTEGPCACLYYAKGQARRGKKKPYPIYTITAKDAGNRFRAIYRRITASIVRKSGVRCE
jgi:hypothetical protein